MLLARPFAAAGALALVFSGAVSDACAQQIFKITGPDGRVTFSDKAPSDPGTKAEAAKVVTLNADGTSGLASLPFELRQAAQRYPVTLYSSPGCGTCAQGRSFLVSRGIPFAEKTVATKEDGDALMRLAGTQNVPLLTIGGQQLKGYSDSEWAQFLDAAGYPKSSQLPSSYVPPAAQPLVALDQRQPAAAAQNNGSFGNEPAQQSRRARAPQQTAEPPQENPAGITF
ncbi:MAG TPA: glutaredoxin family protein [Ramlibacter sp.]|nr:glutaredoxin family protein [Ramlibacter sp.]